MNPQKLSRSNQLFERTNGTQNLRFQLYNQAIEPFLVLEITNIATGLQYEVYMENCDITRSKQLSSIFLNVEELYMKLVDAFDQLNIRTQEKDAILKFEVDVGKPKKEEKQDTQKRFKKWKFEAFANTSAQTSTNLLPSKIEIERCYAEDLKYFKSELKNSIDVIVNNKSVEDCKISDRQGKVQLKNMFIAFSNAIMRVCRQNSVIVNDQARKTKNVITKPPNRMLVQKNKFFETVLEGGLERVQGVQAQQMKLNLNPDVPSDLIVVLQNGEEVSLDAYLQSYSSEEVEKRVKFHDSRTEQFARARQYLKEIQEEICLQTKKQLKEISRRKQLIENYKRKKNQQNRSQSLQL